jgi:ComF family protein
MSHWFRARLAALVETLYPVTCLRCGTPVTGHIRLCDACWPELPWLGSDRCPRCGRAGVDPAVPCGRCQQRPPAFSAVHAPLAYAEPVPDWVQGLKYHQRLGLAPTLAALAGAGLAAEGFDLLVPVPLHRTRLARRGFNQAQLLCRELGKRHGLPVRPTALRRERDTRPQVGLADRRRGANVRGAFSARPERVRGQRILLIDDVVTTGATADAAAEALRAAGASRVVVVAVARA